MTICACCGRDIDEIGCDNVGTQTQPLCEDCARLEAEAEYYKELDHLEFERSICEESY